MKKHIVCFGDSNTHGYCAETGGRFDEESRWTSLLQAYLGDGYLILEEGLSGRTTCFDDPIHEGLSGLDYIYPCLMTHEPVDLLIIMLGSNDCKAQFGASAAEIAEGLRQVMEKAKEGGAADFRVLLVAPAVMTERIMHSGFGAEFDQRSIEVSKELAGVYGSLAKKCGCDFLDGTKVTQVSGIDGLHLDAEGHGRLAEAVCDWVKNML